MKTTIIGPVVAVLTVFGAHQASAAGQVCPEIFRPVCAVKHGKQQTFTNSCFAKVAHARIIHQGACHKK